jgi:hypothetical protein
VLHYFSDVKYKNEAVLAEAFRLTVNSLLHDKEPPVKVIYILKIDAKLPITSVLLILILIWSQLGPWIRIQIQTNIEKKITNYFFFNLAVFFWGLKASLVSWTK